MIRKYINHPVAELLPHALIRSRLDTCFKAYLELYMWTFPGKVLDELSPIIQAGVFVLFFIVYKFVYTLLYTDNDVTVFITTIMNGNYMSFVV